METDNNSWERTFGSAAPFRRSIGMNVTIQITIQKSPIPIIWLDTSIIFYMTQWKYKIGRLNQTILNRVSNLYNQIYDSTRAGKLICPLAEQEEEIWVERDKWLDTMHSLTFGIVTAGRQSVHDKQFCAFMTAYVQRQNEVRLDYKDAFLADPVEDLKVASKGPVYVYVKPPILFGEDYAKNQKKTLLSSLNEGRKKNVKKKIGFEEQLEAEYMGELKALLTLKKQFLAGQFKDEHEQMNAVFGTMNLNQQLRIWEECSGKSNDFHGLVQFYKSQHYRSMPYTNLSCNLTAKLMIDKQDIRNGDNMDINHVSILMPYSDLFITDKAMSAFLRRKKFDKKYNTKICYIGDTQDIDSFFAVL